MPNKDAKRIELTFLNDVTEELANQLLERWGRTYSGILDWSLPRRGHSRNVPSELSIERGGPELPSVLYCVVEVSKHAPMNWLLTQLQAQPQVDAGQTFELEEIVNPLSGWPASGPAGKVSKMWVPK